jgi:hypothetical protein
MLGPPFPFFETLGDIQVLQLRHLFPVTPVQTASSCPLWHTSAIQRFDKGGP